MKIKNLIVANIIVIMSCMVFSFYSPLQAQVNSYSCRQVVNGAYNGQTSVISIEYLPNGSVKATRTVRNSTQADSVSMYNLTSDPLRKINNKAKLKLADNRWFIPFEGIMALRATGPGDSEAECNCASEKGKCNLWVIPGKMTCKADSADPCTGCCEMTITWSGVVVTGSGIFVDATSVNYVR